MPVGSATFSIFSYQMMRMMMTGLRKKTPTHISAPKASPGVIDSRLGREAKWIESKSMEMMSRTMYSTMKKWLVFGLVTYLGGGRGRGRVKEGDAERHEEYAGSWGLGTSRKASTMREP